MPRKSPSRLDLRRAAEAADAQEKKAEAAAPAKAKKAPTTKAKRTKEKPVARKRLLWVVYNGSMKEEGRFAYDQRAAAEERIEALRQKSKKMYFIQPVKEIIGAESPSFGLAAAAAAAALAAAAEEELAAAVAAAEAEIPDEIVAEMEEEVEEEEEEEEEDDAEE